MAFLIFNNRMKRSTVITLDERQLSFMSKIKHTTSCWSWKCYDQLKYTRIKNFGLALNHKLNQTNLSISCNILLQQYFMRFQVLTAASMMFRAVFWVVLPCKIILGRRSLMMEAVCTSETSVDNHFTRQYNTEDTSEHQQYFML
jgi:hypothetical protein